MDATQAVDVFGFDDIPDANPTSQAEVGFLQIQGPSGSGRAPLFEGVNYIGRKACQTSTDLQRLQEWQSSTSQHVHGVFIDDKSVSSKHAAIYVEGTNALWFVKDLRSKNKSFLKRGGAQTALQPDDRYTIQPGDVLQFGTVQCTLYQAPATSAPAGLPPQSAHGDTHPQPRSSSVVQQVVTPPQCASAPAPSSQPHPLHARLFSHSPSSQGSTPRFARHPMHEQIAIPHPRHASLLTAERAPSLSEWASLRQLSLTDWMLEDAEGSLNPANSADMPCESDSQSISIADGIAMAPSLGGSDSLTSKSSEPRTPSIMAMAESRLRQSNALGPSRLSASSSTLASLPSLSPPVSPGTKRTRTSDSPGRCSSGTCPSPKSPRFASDCRLVAQQLA